MDQHSGQEHVDTGNLGSFTVGTHGKHVLAEDGLIPDEPHQSGQQDSIQHIQRHGGVAHVEHGGTQEVTVDFIQTADGGTVVEVKEPQDDAVGDQLGGQCHDEGVQAELRHKEAVDQTDDGTDGQNAQQRNEHPEGGNFGQESQHLVCVVNSLQECAGDGSGQTDSTACGQVGTGQNDTAGDTQSHGQVSSNLNDQVAQATHGKEVGALDGGVDAECQHQNIQSIIQNQIGDVPLLILLAHLLIFSSSALQRCNRICHFVYPP